MEINRTKVEVGINLKLVGVCRVGGDMKEK